MRGDAGRRRAGKAVPSLPSAPCGSFPCASGAGQGGCGFFFGIEGLYGKFGFATSLANSSFTVWVRRLMGQRFTRPFAMAAFTPKDAPAIAALFNGEHACRPWTLQRSPDALSGTQPREVWRPTPEIITVRCWTRHIPEFTVLEPYDSTVGFAAVPAKVSSQAAFDDLLARRAVPDDGELVRLLPGYHSWHEAEKLGVPAPEAHRAVYTGWFPGDCPPVLPMAYAHFMDHAPDAPKHSID